MGRAAPPHTIRIRGHPIPHPTGQPEQTRRPQKAAAAAWEDGWERQWLQEHAWDNPVVTEQAFAAGVIGTRDYLDGTRPRLLADIDQLIVSSVASTLTIEEALLVIGSREPGP